MKKRYKSDILEMVHEDAVANFEIGAISETQMREFDRMCLVPKVETPAKPPRKGAPAYAKPRRV